MRVIVIGAGVIGAAVADALARRGVEAVVLDMRSAGRGASRASAGILAPYTEAQPDSPLLSLGTRSLALFDEFVAGAAGRSGRPIEYARSGTLEVAVSESERVHLQRARGWLDREGIECRWLDPEDIVGEEPDVTRDARGALLILPHAFVGVGSLVAALVQSARLAGAVFEAPVQAASITPRRSGVEVRIDSGTLEADAVVVATGSWSGRVRVTNLPALPVRPVRGQLLHLQVKGPNRPSRVVWGSGCYVVPWSDGSLLVGATVEEAGFDESVTVAGVSGLLRAAMDLLPGVSDASLFETRAGLRPATLDGLPVIGAHPSAPNVCFATGHYRNGVLLSPLTAALVTNLLLDGEKDPSLEHTQPDRF